MAIDPARLEAQRAAVTGKPPPPAAEPEADAGPREYRCPTCRRRTRDRAGMCSGCRANGMTATLDFLTVEQLKTVIFNARAELKKRADLAAEALRKVDA